MEKIVIGPTDGLVTVDMENDFCSEKGALYVSGVVGESTMPVVIANTVTLIKKAFGYRAATFDEHLASGHIEFRRYGKHAVQGTWGARYVDELFPLLSEMNFLCYKGNDPALVSLSVMTSPTFGALISGLRVCGITRIFVCGVAYTHCAGLSAIAIANQGFEVYVVRDATRSVSREYGGDPERMAQQLAFDGVKEITMADLA